MKASVVIPAFSLERLEDIKEAVWSVQAQTYKPTEVIIAVDHNEALMDKLVPLMKDGVRVVLNAGVLGSSETRNVGIRSARGDVVAFLDDDAIAEKDWLERITKHYSKPNVIAVGGNIISVWRNGRPFWFPEELDWAVGGVYKGHPSRLCEVRNLIWVNMSFRREICSQIGYVRTDIGALGNKPRAGDETEFCMRMKSYNPKWKIIYEPRAVVYHKVKPRQEKITHLIRRSFGDGFHKSRDRKIYAGLSERPFSTESNYMCYLLRKSIPERLAGHYGAKGFVQAGTIILSMLVAGVGYLRGAMWR